MRALWTLTLALLALCHTPAAGQVYRLRPVGSNEGLTNSFVHHLVQDGQGYLWIGTGEGAGRFDGRQVVMYTTADGLAENFVSSIHPAPDGTIWFGHNEGGISRMVHEQIHPVVTDSLSGSTINAMVDDGSGGIWAAAQNDGIVHIASDGTVQMAASDAELLWYSLLRLGDRFLLAGTDAGLYLYHLTPSGGLELEPGFGPLTNRAVRALARFGETGPVLAGTDGEGILRIRIKDNGKLEGAGTMGLGAGLSTLSVYDLAVGTDSTLVVGTFGQGAFEMQLGPEGTIAGLQHYHAGNGLGSDNVAAVCTDKENGLWFARFGMGPARLLNRNLVHIAAEDGAALDVTAITTNGPDLWIGGTGVILKMLTTDLRLPDTLTVAQGLPDEAITALACGADGSLWAGSATQGLYHQMPTGRFTPSGLPGDHLSRQVHALARAGGALWVATSNGIYIVGPEGIRHLTTENGLMHNRVNALLVDRQGQVWMACNNGGVSVAKDGEIRSFPLAEGSKAFHVTGVAQDSTGTIWFSTYGNGVRYLDGKDVVGLGEGQGLRSDYSYAITVDGDHGIWVAHRGGVSRIDENTRSVHTFDRAFGIEPDRRMNTLIAGKQGHVWFGTDKGVLRFNKGRRGPVAAPLSPHFTSVKVSGTDVPLDGALELGPGNHRLQFDFLGVSLASPEGVRYRYMLEGHDPEWIEASQSSVQYMRVIDGRYTFRVQAAGMDGVFGPDEAVLPLLIRAPLWKRNWFIAMSVLLIILLAWGIIRLRERNQRRAKQLLQLQLERRTRELVLKNAEIELKNKDITDSINYAQRIQQAILPNGKALDGHLPKNFVINRPRDIVSGDFHWFKRAGDKLTLVCADCTGHGVPGAFMSMIGSMLLREITAERAALGPDRLLVRLDHELRSVLHYHGNGQGSTDGMDISICELDLADRHLSSAAAMHDVVLVRDGRIIRQRGSRRSIGGALTLNGGADIALHETALRPGDRFYLFSDGIPDQFGGPGGKKLKVSGLLSWIEELGHLPLVEQGNVLRQRMDEWMEGQQQIDDMLLIGVEV